MKKRSKLVFISWAPFCSRSDSIARRLGGKSYMVYSPFWGSRYVTIVFKYLIQTLKTLWILFRDRPHAVIVMTPPVVACAPVWLYTKLANATFAIDAHTAAFVTPPWNKMFFLHAFFSRRAVTTAVTNLYLEKIVRSWCAQTTIVTDVPVYFANPNPFVTTSAVNMTLVSSFTPDEPLENFLQAAARLPNMHFFVTGNYKDTDETVLRLKPQNVTLTGYLSNADYVGLMLASDAVISLTTENHTMQRGAYEAVYLNKPVITSNFEVLRKAFRFGAVHVNNDIEDIVRGIMEMKNNIERYKEEVQLLRREKLNQWKNVKSELNHLLFGSNGLHSADYCQKSPQAHT